MSRLLMERDLVRADLNLLKVLHVLLEERNITHAADRLFVSPSAISKALRRLRELFDDPLLVRSQHGLVLTTRAQSLVAPVKSSIIGVGELLRLPTFDPLTARGKVRIAAPESFVAGALPNLILRLKEAAPDMVIESHSLGDDYLELLSAGSLEFAVYFDQPCPEGFRKYALLSAMPCLWFREDHPLGAKKAIDLADICSYPLIAFHYPRVAPSVAPEHLRRLEGVIAEAGLARTVITNTSHLLVAMEMLIKSDAVMLAPEYLTLDTMFKNGVASKAVQHIPAFSEPDSVRFQLSLIQHERTLGSPLHQWLTLQLKSAYEAVANTSLPERK